jgi:hypothetical protein
MRDDTMPCDTVTCGSMFLQGSNFVVIGAGIREAATVATIPPYFEF